MKATQIITALVCALFLSFPVLASHHGEGGHDHTAESADKEGMKKRMHKKGKRKEMKMKLKMDACEGKKATADCSFTKPNGKTKSGTCGVSKGLGGKLVCKKNK